MTKTKISAFCILILFYCSISSVIAKNDIATFPFQENFENPNIASYWTLQSTNKGRIQLTPLFKPNDRQHISMDSSIKGQYSLNELILTLDLFGQSDVYLSFYHKKFSDENHELPENFEGSFNGDGVSISQDGLHWYRIQEFTDDYIQSEYKKFVINLDRMLETAQMDYTSDFKIKFQQYDDYSIRSDGFVLDDICLYKGNIETPEIRIISPNGGEYFEQGTTQNICWQCSGNTGRAFKIEIFQSNMNNAIFQAETFIPDLSDDGITYSWKIPYLPLDKEYIAKITSLSNEKISDSSNDTFSLLQGVSGKASYPYIETFESVHLQDCWYSQSTHNGRIRLIDNHGPKGNQHLAMDSESGVYALNELILVIDLADESDVALEFLHKEYFDEDHMMPETFTGSHNSDGIAISADGFNWFKIDDLSSQNDISTGYQKHYIDLDAAIVKANIPFTNAFMIKFQQYDNYNLNIDGFCFDEIKLFSRNLNPNIASFPFAEDFECGNLAAYWTQYSTRSGRINITRSYNPFGQYHLTMDAIHWGWPSLNELILSIDLSYQYNVVLELQHKQLNDEHHAMPEMFKHHSNSDGIAISTDDGTTWYRIHDLKSLNNLSSYEKIVINMDELLKSHALFYTEHFLIKFQQYDNYPLPIDGFAFDNIKLYQSEIDQEKPEISISGIPDSVIPGSYELAVIAKDNSFIHETGYQIADSYTVYVNKVDNILKSEAQQNYKITIEDNWIAGQYFLNCWAMDFAGNIQTTGKEFYLVGSIIGLPETVRREDSFTLTLTAASDIGLSLMTLMISDGKDHTKDFRKSWDVSNINHAMKMCTVDIALDWKVGEVYLALWVLDKDLNLWELNKIFILIE
ncbi:peptidase S8 and S53 subtilisin kexin sedolisin [Candidatus Magnetomorum sp. HK-1]|nr:peptidase S8 and S53 subtilisin kexin sedolisin [Candidatus Magnetomorum sp. HK-1]